MYILHHAAPPCHIRTFLPKPRPLPIEYISLKVFLGSPPFDTQACAAVCSCSSLRSRRGVGILVGLGMYAYIYSSWCGCAWANRNKIK